MTRRELLARMDSPELSLQMAYDALLAEERDPDRPPTPEELGAKMRALFGSPPRRPGETFSEPR